MKQVLIFVAGMIAGALLFYGISSVSEKQEKEEAVETLVNFLGEQISEIGPQKPQITFFKKPGECISDYKYEVKEVLEPGYAIVYEVKKESFGDYTTLRKALLYDPNKKPFYDKQIIVIPKGCCARHIGTYKYGYRSENTAPVVQIMKK